MVAQGSIIEFRNFLIYLDDITPKELKLKEMQDALEILDNLLKKTLS